jgi:hypothetical protein
MDIYTWGEYKIINKEYIIVYKPNSNLEYHIQIFEDHHEVELRIRNKILLQFMDVLRNGKKDLTTFTRLIKNQFYIFENGELIVKKINRKVTFLQKIKKDIFPSDKYITMDLETKEIDNKLVPYCVSIYDGEISKSFYLLDYKDSDSMLESAIKYLMKRKFDNYKIYIHNWSYFDGVFLLRILSNLSDKIQIKKRDGRLIDVKFTFDNNYNLYFRDSYLLLPCSLRKLSSFFKVENKGIFPYRFVNNKNIELDYIGKFPHFRFFESKDILSNRNEYLNYKNEFKDKLWNFREESIKYCEQDCISLYQVIREFSRNIFILYTIDSHKYPTLSSLAFGIYRSNFLKDEYKIPLIQGPIYDFIKQSYFGGKVDVFKPYGENVHGYDVNSLYPYSMK